MEEPGGPVIVLEPGGVCAFLTAPDATVHYPDGAHYPKKIDSPPEFYDARGRRLRWSSSGLNVVDNEEHQERIRERVRGQFSSLKDYFDGNPSHSGDLDDEETALTNEQKSKVFEDFLTEEENWAFDRFATELAELLHPVGSENSGWTLLRLGWHKPWTHRCSAAHHPGCR